MYTNLQGYIFGVLQQFVAKHCSLSNFGNFFRKYLYLPPNKELVSGVSCYIVDEFFKAQYEPVLSLHAYTFSLHEICLSFQTLLNRP